MAATMSSPWAKPGAWALEAEEHDAAELQHQQAKTEPLADFPSLSAAAVAKPKKKNKPQKVSLAEFTAFGGPKPEPVGLTHEDRLSLPTGPRERTAEELDRSRGFRSYGGGGDRGSREESDSKWVSQRRERPEASERDAPSRADEVDDWGAGKRATASGGGFDRKERVGFGFGSNSKADESDSWVSNKSSSSFSSIRSGGGGFERDRKVGFASNGWTDSECWGRKREENNGGGFERKVGLGFNSNGADTAKSWGRRREESSNGGSESAGRPRLNLQPRTLPVTMPVVVTETSPVAAVVVGPPEIVPKTRTSNPFGAARPREEVLAEKGQDWKKIDEQLESVKIKEKEAVVAPDGESFGKRSFGMGNGLSGDRTEGAWRKPVVAEAEGEARPQSYLYSNFGEQGEQVDQMLQIKDTTSLLAPVRAPRGRALAADESESS